MIYNNNNNVYIHVHNCIYIYYIYNSTPTEVVEDSLVHWMWFLGFVLQVTECCQLADYISQLCTSFIAQLGLAQSLRKQIADDIITYLCSKE